MIAATGSGLVARGRGWQWGEGCDGLKVAAGVAAAADGLGWRGVAEQKGTSNYFKTLLQPDFYPCAQLSFTGGPSLHRMARVHRRDEMSDYVGLN